MAELHGPELSIDGHSLSEEQHHEKKKQVMDQKTLNRNRQARCCLCCYNGKCVRCSCVMNGKNCQNCLPSRNSLCSNLPSNVSSTNINHPTSSETLVSSSSSSRLSEIGPVPQSDVNSSHFDFSDNTTAAILTSVTTQQPPSRQIYQPSDVSLHLENCYLLLIRLTTSIPLLNLPMTRSCVGREISSNFLLVTLQTSLFRSWHICLMLM